MINFKSRDFGRWRINGPYDIGHSYSLYHVKENRQICYTRDLVGRKGEISVCGICKALPPKQLVMMVLLLRAGM